MGNMPSSSNIIRMNQAMEDREYARQHQREAARKAEAALKADQDLSETAHARSLQLSDLLPGEREWEEFWATVPENASNAQIIAAIEDRLAQIQGPHQQGEEVGR